MEFDRRSCLGEGPFKNELVMDSDLVASTDFIVWYSSENSFNLSEWKMARSRFLIMKSVAVNQRCSRHSSADGRLLFYESNSLLKFMTITFIEYSQRCSFEDIHKESGGFLSDFLMQTFEAVTDKGDVGFGFILIGSSERTSGG